MSEEEVERFLLSTTFSAIQKLEVQNSRDKNKAYSQLMRWILIAKAHNKIIELRTALKRRSILMPRSFEALART
jgi:hypothetical protein